MWTPPASVLEIVKKRGNTVTTIRRREVSGSDHRAGHHAWISRSRTRRSTVASCRAGPRPGCQVR
jgi:hypothetical protein